MSGLPDPLAYLQPAPDRMVAINDVQAKVASFGWTELRELWRQVAHGETPGWAAGEALEYLVLRAFELDGAEVRWPYEVVFEDEVLEQIDGAVYVDGLSCLIECKDVSSPVNVAPIAKMRNQLLRRPAGTTGLMFSRAGYTAPALALARHLAPQCMLLWFPAEIEHAVRQEGIRELLREKYRRCVEDGVADHHLELVRMP